MTCDEGHTASAAAPYHHSLSFTIKYRHYQAAVEGNNPGTATTQMMLLCYPVHRESKNDDPCKAGQQQPSKFNQCITAMENECHQLISIPFTYGRTGTMRVAFTSFLHQGPQQHHFRHHPIEPWHYGRSVMCWECILQQLCTG